jgi:hypothetical protein
MYNIYTDNEMEDYYEEGYYEKDYSNSYYEDNFFNYNKKIDEITSKQDTPCNYCLSDDCTHCEYSKKKFFQ